MATAEYYLKQWRDLNELAAATPDTSASAALRMRAAEYLTIAKALAESASSPQVPAGTQQQQNQPKMPDGEQPERVPSSRSLKQRACPDCGKVMRLTTVRPNLRYSNLDECDFGCEACGKAETFLVARQE